MCYPDYGPPLMVTHMQDHEHKRALFYGHVMVAASFVIQLLAWGTRNSIGIFFNPWITEFGWLRATISGAISLSFIVHGFISIFVGGLNDRFGPRLTMTFCGFFLGLGYLLMTGVHAVWQLYLFYGIIVAVGQSGMDVILLSAVARWFEKKRGVMSGLVKMGTGAGMVIMPIFINRILAALGWRTSFAILSFTILLCIISLAQILVRDPAKKGQFPDNQKQATSGGKPKVESGLSFREAVHTRQFLTVCAAYFLILFCVQSILVHIVQHAIDVRISAAHAAQVLSTIGAVSIAGRFVLGGAGDRIGHRAAVMICFLFLFAGLLWLLLSRTLWMFYLFAFVYGFAHGGFFALFSPLVAGLFGTSAHGIIFGSVIFVGNVGGAIGPLLAGYVFDETRSYHAVFLIFAILNVLGLLLIASLKPIPSPNSYARRVI